MSNTRVLKGCHHFYLLHEHQTLLTLKCNKFKTVDNKAESTKAEENWSMRVMVGIIKVLCVLKRTFLNLRKESFTWFDRCKLSEHFVGVQKIIYDEIRTDYKTDFSYLNLSKEYVGLVKGKILSTEWSRIYWNLILDDE